MIIRKLEPLEIEAGWAFRLRSLQECPTAFGLSFEDVKDVPLEAVKSDFEGNDVFIALSDEGEIIGMLGFQHERGEKHRHKATIGSMYVVAELRGKGIGRKLLDAVISHAKSISNLKKINLTVEASNNAAILLYKSVGFVSFGLEKDSLQVEGEFYDLLYMTLHLSSTQ